MTSAEQAAFIRECAMRLKDAHARERCEAVAKCVAFGAGGDVDRIECRQHRAAVDDSLWAVEGWGNYPDRKALQAVLAVLDGQYDHARALLAEARRARTREGL